MGTVYEVRAAGGGRRLALKLLTTLKPEVVQRFVREARVLEFLGQHPNVVSLEDVGTHDDIPYIVMPLLEGGTLSGLLELGDADTGELIQLVIQVARALHFAHEAGVIHRDVKPSNVLLSRGRPAQALLSDFGVAKNLLDEKLTETGSMLGTPAYMAPEQIRGQKIDRRVDVYGLGVLLYQALTRRLPFEGESLRVVPQVLSSPPRPPSELDPDVPPELERICLVALSKTPEERQQTAEAFAQQLEQLTGPTVASRPPQVSPSTLLGLDQPVPSEVGRLVLVGVLSIALGLLLGLALIRASAG